MADPTAIVPYHDPFDDSTQPTENILVFDENHSIPQSVEFPLTEPINCFNHSIPQSVAGNGIAEANDPLLDPFVWDMCNLPTTSNFHAEAGLDSEFFCATSSNPQETQIPQPQNSSEFGEPVQLPIWPVPPVAYSCTCCHVLREITHCNGFHVTKLEIHGRLGMICHAILENRYGDDWNASSQYQMFDFCKKSIEAVREFLVQYCEQRKQAGYTMLQDPLLIFYEALCVGLNGDDNLDTNDFFQTFSADSGGEYQMNQPEFMNQQGADQSEEARPTKSSLAAQRERTGKLTLKDFVGYFHLPIDDAAKKMNICPTVMKKICRKHGLFRWPYRKIKSIERKISTKRSSLSTRDTEERSRAQTDIEKLQQELASIFAAFND